MELGWNEVDRPKVLITHRDTDRIGVVVQRGLNRETGSRGGIADQVNDDFCV